MSQLYSFQASPRVTHISAHGNQDEGACRRSNFNRKRVGQPSVTQQGMISLTMVNYSKVLMH